MVAGLTQAMGAGLGLILAIGFLASCASLVASALGGFGERSLAGIKVSLICAIVCALAYLIVQALFNAGGVPYEHYAHGNQLTKMSLEMHPNDNARTLGC
jgi:hypothetical protein